MQHFASSVGGLRTQTHYRCIDPGHHVVTAVTPPHALTHPFEKFRDSPTALYRRSPP